MAKGKMPSSHIEEMSRGHIREYLQSIVLMANEVIDLYTHDATLLDRKSGQFEHYWHFITGFSSLKKKPSEKYERFLRKVLSKKRAMIERPFVSDEKPEIKSDIYIPLRIDNRDIGVLCIGPPEGQKFSEYDAYLMTCIISIVDTGFSSKTAREIGKNFLAPLQFCLLHRRRYLSAAANVNDVINQYFNSIVLQKVFPLFSPQTGEISVNFRLTSAPYEESDNVTLIFAEPMENVSIADSKRARKRKPTFTTQQIEVWINSWSKFVDSPPPDIDNGYGKIFPRVKSHIAVPCEYGGILYGILTIDFYRSYKFTPLVAQMLCIIGAQMAPVVANAQASSELARKQAYFESVLDAIPDQITIIDKNAYIQLMNKARRDKFPTAKKGDLCYETFEVGKDSECKGCYTLSAARIGKAVKQASWEYAEPHVLKRSYVDISAGQLKNEEGEPLQPLQAVEVVRDVNEREEMLKWMSKIQFRLIDKNLPENVWKYVGEGLKDMGFESYKIYIYSRSRFLGKICYPKESFKRRDFTQFSLNPKIDTPSRVLLEEERLRPVQFIVRKKGGKAPDEKKEWNYITHYLTKVPPKYAKHFSMEGIRSWVEIPIGLAGKLFGKIVVEKRLPDELHDTEPNAYEMAILASFGRFASIVMQTAKQQEELVKSVKESARMEFARYPKAILELYELQTLPTDERIKLLNWATLLPIVSSDAFNISRVQHFVIKKEGKDIWIVTGAGIGARRLKGVSPPAKKLRNELTKLFDAYPPNNLDGNVIAEMSEELSSISSKITPRLADGCIGAITNDEIANSILGEVLKSGEPKIVKPSKDLSSLDRKFLEFAQETERVEKPFVYIPITSPRLSITQQQGFLYLDNIFRKDPTISLDDVRTIGAFVSILGGLYASEKTRWQLNITLGVVGHAIKYILSGCDFEQEMALWQLDVLKSFLSPEKTVQIDKHKHLDPTTELKLVLDETIAYIKKRAKERKATVQQIYEAPNVPATDESFKGSSILLKVVLYQLLDNAVKFTSIARGNQKEVGIRIDDSSDKPGYIHLVVWDTGIGVDKYLMPRLGKDWYRSEQCDEGAGIGLITCYKLLEEWTGRPDNFEVRDNVEGKGSEFHIWIPRHKN
jgi:putative methionine-R-sulfoxide reductase with GAF domain